jgi:hypothetical protein
MGSGYRTFTAGEVLTASNVQNYLQDQAVMVFAGTAARSSAIGTANFEEGMLTYLTDVDKLQVYTGAAFADVYPAAAAATPMGVLINSTSFSGVTSQSFNNVFNATYDNYRILYNLTSTNAADTLSLRLRASGTDNTGATNYRTSRIVVTDVSTTTRQSTNLQQLVTNTNTITAGSIDVFNPFPNNQTYTIAHSVSGNAASEYVTSGMRMVDNNSFDGFTIICAANMTGAISVYGVNK